MRLRIEKVREQSADRPAGYFEDVISRGIVDGEWLEIKAESLAELREKYRPTVEEPLPPVLTMAASATRAAVSETAAVVRGEPPVSEEEAERRLTVCRSCEHFRHSDGRCPKCGCFMEFKAMLRSQRCPDGKW